MTKDDSRPLTRNLAPFGVRMPPDLKDRVEAAAKSNNRSMNAEIVAALEEKFPAPMDSMREAVDEAFRYLLTLNPDDRQEFINGLEESAKLRIGDENARNMAVSVYKILNDHAPKVEYWQRQIEELEAKVAEAKRLPDSNRK